MSFRAEDYADARAGKRQVRATSRRSAAKPRTSPYRNIHMLNQDAVAAKTRALLRAFPASASQIVDAVLAAWDSIAESRIGRARIGIDLFPTPQVIGNFRHELIPLEMQAQAGADWRGDYFSDEKDLVYLPNGRFSSEIKTSSHRQQVFGNRSFGQQDAGRKKKDKDGYYIAVNFTGWSREDDELPEPRVRTIRVGWLDHVDWLAQSASSGQAAALPPLVENAQLLTIYSVEEA